MAYSEDSDFCAEWQEAFESFWAQQRHDLS